MRSPEITLVVADNRCAERIHIDIKYVNIFSGPMASIGNGKPAAMQTSGPAKGGITAADTPPAEAPTPPRASEEVDDSNYFHSDAPCLLLDNRTVTSESGENTWCIVGKVKNACDRNMSYVQVEIAFMDPSGNLENSGMVNVNNLAAGQTWAFKKAVYESNTSSGTWKIEKVTGF